MTKMFKMKKQQKQQSLKMISQIKTFSNSVVFHIIIKTEVTKLRKKLSFGVCTEEGKN